MKKKNIYKGMMRAVSALLMALTLVCSMNTYTSAATVTFDERNAAVKSYMGKVSYNKKSYKISYISKFISTTKAYDDPAGYPIMIAANGVQITLSNGKTSWSDQVTPGQKYTIYNLLPGVTYQYKVKDVSGNVLQSGSLKAAGAPRMIYLKGPRNFRDLGGWKANGGTIRYGLLIRGAAVRTNDGLLAEDDDLAILSERLGIKSEIDLRKDSEVSGEDGIYGNEDDITYSDISGATYQRYAINSYTDSLNRTKVSYKNLVKVLRVIMKNAVAGKTTYFHCQVGADRTGTISFLLEGLLGVSQSNMDKDFELTSFTGSTYRPRNGTKYKYSQLVSYMKKVPGKTWEDKFVQWFSCAGFTTKEMNAFRKAMISGKPKTVKAKSHSYGSYKTTKAATVFKTGTKTKTCTVCKATKSKTVSKLKATLSLSTGSKTITRGSSFTLKISNLANGDSVSSVSSSNSGVASVSGSGRSYTIRGKSNGSAKIRVKLASGKTKSCSVKVKKPQVTKTNKTTTSKVTTQKRSIKEKLLR